MHHEYNYTKKHKSHNDQKRFDTIKLRLLIIIGLGIAALAITLAFLK